MESCFDKDKYTNWYLLKCQECGTNFMGKAKNQKRCNDCREKIRVCKQCGERIYEKGRQICDSCRDAKMRPRYYPVCESCGNRFETGRANQRFCSPECRRTSIAAIHEERTCPNCGKTFISSNAKHKYCSRKCKRQFNGSETRYNRTLSSDSRLREVTRKDRRVWLMPLIKRDKNICALCGKPCDLYDYDITETGVMIAGENYPSIDHIIPISKGGSHQWDNVQLAHRSCNRIKGNGKDK